MRKYDVDYLIEKGRKCFVQVCDKYTYTSEPPHTHGFVEMVYILGGEGTHMIDDSEYKVSRGDMLFINYKQIHSFTTDNKMTIANVLLTPDYISEELVTADNAFALLSLSAFTDFRERYDPNKSLVHFDGEEREEIEILIRRLDKECDYNMLGNDTILRSGITMILTYLFRKISLNAHEENNADIPAPIFDYISEHLAEPITLEALAKQTFYNPSYFSRMFKEKCGMTLTSYLRKSRLERACTLLKKNEMSISDIAMLSGFGTTSSFHKKFKEAYGVTPNQWKKTNSQK